MSRFLVLLVVTILLAGCDSESATNPGEVEAAQGDALVRAESDPAPVQAGEPVTITVTVLNAGSGEPLVVEEVRPVVQLRTATSTMILPFEITPTDQPGQVQVSGVPPEEGRLQLSVGVKREGVLTPIRLPDIPVRP